MAGKYPGVNPKFTAEYIREKAIEYIDKSSKINELEMIKPATMAGFALYCGMTKMCLFNYFNGDRAGISEEDKAILKDTHMYLKTYLEDQLESNGLCGRVNPTIAIFSLKNNHGWKDRHEVDQNVSVKGKLEDFFE